MISEIGTALPACRISTLSENSPPADRHASPLSPVSLSCPPCPLSTRHPSALSSPVSCPLSSSGPHNRRGAPRPAVARPIVTYCGVRLHGLSAATLPLPVRQVQQAEPPPLARRSRRPNRKGPRRLTALQGADRNIIAVWHLYKYLTFLD